MYNEYCGVSASFTDRVNNSVSIISGTSIHSNNKERKKEMSLVKIFYKPDFVVVAGDRRVVLCNEPRTISTFQTNHKKIKYIEKYNCVVSAVGLLKYNDIWWDDYIDPIINENDSVNSFLMDLEQKIIKDSYNLELQVMSFNNGIPLLHSYDPNQKKFINLSYSRSNVYYENRSHHFGEISLGNYIAERMPIQFSNEDYLVNYAINFISKAIKIGEFATKELSEFQSVMCPTIGYPIDVIVINKHGPKFITVPSPQDMIVF